MSLRVLSLPKDGGVNMDAFAYASEGRGMVSRFAVADGVSSQIYSNILAQTVVDKFAEKGFDSCIKGTLLAIPWPEISHATAFNHEASEENLEGSACTLACLEISAGDSAEFLCVGDCVLACLNGELLEFYDGTGSIDCSKYETTSEPDVLHCPLGKTVAQIEAKKFHAGQLRIDSATEILLMSDGIGAWLIGSAFRKENPVDNFRILTRFKTLSRFVEWTRAEEKSRKLSEDDHTFLWIECGEFLPAPPVSPGFSSAPIRAPDEQGPPKVRAPVKTMGLADCEKRLSSIRDVAFHDNGSLKEVRLNSLPLLILCVVVLLLVISSLLIVSVKVSL